MGILRKEKYRVARFLRLSGKKGAIVLLIVLTGLCRLKAATNVVTSLANDGPGSLRAVLNASAPGDTITFAVQGSILLSGTPLPVNKNVIIEGPGKDNLLIDGQSQITVFDVTNNVTARISDLSVTNGHDTTLIGSGSGGGVKNRGNLTLTRCVIVHSATEAGIGGGIFNGGNLTMTQCSLSNNFAVGGGGAIGDSSTGKLILDRTTLNQNVAASPEGSEGGGLFKILGSAYLTNVTVSGNTAGNGDGGGIFTSSFMFIESSTIASNRAVSVNGPTGGRGGGIDSFGSANVQLHNTIVAGNSSSIIPPVSGLSIGPDIFGIVFSQGWNLIQNPTNATIAGVLTGNLIGVDPKLLPLGNNGGYVWTHGLDTNSPAIDAASPFDFPHGDGRELVRPQDGNGDLRFISDIGAFEKETVIPGSIPSSFVVTSLADDNSAGTLRVVVSNAPPQSRITFAVTGTIILTNGQIVINKNLLIEGPGESNLSINPQIPINQEREVRAFLITSNVVASVFDLTIFNGRGEFAGGDTSGGGVFNFGNLTMTRCLIRNCSAEFGFGGGIASVGPLTLRQCTVVSNLAAFGGGGLICSGRLIMDRSTVAFNRAFDTGRTDGGGIFILGGTALITNSTISGNFVSVGNGGGISAGSYVRLESCTVVSNSAFGFKFSPTEVLGEGGGVFTTSVIESRNTIFAGNSATTEGPGGPFSFGPDIFGQMLSQGWNLIQNPSGATIFGVLTGNQIGVDPKLGPLQDNGGPTPTHALLTGSPAIDSGSPFTFPFGDQRDVARPQDGNGDGIAITDIGAYEELFQLPNL